MPATSRACRSASRRTRSSSDCEPDAIGMVMTRSKMARLQLSEQTAALALLEQGRQDLSNNVGRKFFREFLIGPVQRTAEFCQTDWANRNRSTWSPAPRPRL